MSALANRVTALRPASQRVDVSEIRSATLEQLLLGLWHYGSPSVYSDKDGWRVSVNVNVTATGAKFEVASAFNHPTPTAAAQQCLERLESAMAQIRGVLK